MVVTVATVVAFAVDMMVVGTGVVVAVWYGATYIWHNDYQMSAILDNEFLYKHTLTK